MSPRGITIAAALSIVACSSSAAPRGVETAAGGSLVMGVRNELAGDLEVHAVRLLLGGEPVASLETSGSGEDWTPALDVGETRVFSQDLPAGSQVTVEVSALVGQEQVVEVAKLEVPARTVAVLATLLVEEGIPVLRIEKVALSELEGEGMCTEPGPEEVPPGC